jgi:two-component system chemotaxis response regulator CheY
VVLTDQQEQQTPATSGPALRLLSSGYAMSALPALQAKTRAHILVVDDDPDMRETARLLLEPHGYVVDTAADGAAGLAAARATRYDVVITDIAMPGMNGMELGRALRRDPLVCSVGMIVHTALDESQVRRSFVEYDVFVPKACAYGRMLEAISKLTGRPSAKALR